MSLSRSDRETELRLGVVADDLTGANATGVRLAALGMEVWSAVTAGRVPRLEGPAQAGVVVTESRAIPAREAAARVVAAARELLAAGASSFGKRIDSTVRGNLGAELEAMMKVLDEADRPHLALVVPAYPASGRVVAGGYLLVHGVPVQETAAGVDPSAPVRASRVQTVLRSQTALEIQDLELETILEGAGAVRAALEDAARQGRRVVVADATTDRHLEILAEAAVHLAIPVLSVDPGPFTAALARARLAGSGRTIPAPDAARAPGGRPRGGPRGGPPLAGVVGSVTPLSLRQVARAAEQGMVRPILLDVERLVPEDAPPGPPEAARLQELFGGALEQALACLRRRGVPLLVTSSPDRPLLPPEAGPTVAAAVGAVAALLVNEAARQGTPLGGLYLSGGDVTVATCRALDSPVLRLQAEVEPLVAFARLAEGPHAGLSLVTKGGLVGDDEALVRCLGFLAEHARPAG